MSVTIRRAIEEDWSTLRALRLAALRDAPTAFGVRYEDALAYTEQQWRERAAGRGAAEYLLAFASDEAVGMLAGVVDGQGEYNLIAMWVAPSQRGRAVAGALVRAAQARARARGHDRVVLDVAPDNQAAARLYLKHGFVFLDQVEPLASHPHIVVQKMAWQAS